MSELRELWIVVNIGCIECGVSSNIVGVFSTRGVADELVDRLAETHGWREDGQNAFEVFLMPSIDVVNPEYDGVLSV